MITKRFKVELTVEVDAPNGSTTEDMRKFLASELAGASCLFISDTLYEEGEYEIIDYQIDEQ